MMSLNSRLSGVIEENVCYLILLKSPIAQNCFFGWLLHGFIKNKV